MLSHSLTIFQMLVQHEIDAINASSNEIFLSVSSERIFSQLQHRSRHQAGHGRGKMNFLFEN